MKMDNKFYSKDISKFDPTNASVEDIRRWIFAIIDAELEKGSEEIDYDLLEECAKLDAELPDTDFEISESEYAAGLERIKALVPATEHKETKVLKPKKKTKKSVRIIAILAASLAVLLLSLTVVAAVQGMTLSEFIIDNIKTVFDMDTGDKLDDAGVSLIKNGELIKYSSIEDAISSINIDLLYPTYLPDGIKVERIAIFDADDNGSKVISYVTNNINFSVEIHSNNRLPSSAELNSTIFENDIAKFYIMKMDDTFYQVVTLYNNMSYSITYNDYDELIKILDAFKEIEK